MERKLTTQQKEDQLYSDQLDIIIMNQLMCENRDMLLSGGSYEPISYYTNNITTNSYDRSEFSVVQQIVVYPLKYCTTNSTY